MSSISREIKRNTGLRGYRHKQAQDKATISVNAWGILRGIRLLAQTCIKLLKSVAALSVTFDNGKEFAAHQRLRAARIDTFFADPYCAIQRARNENTNGLIQQYLRCPFSGVSHDEIQFIQDALNHRPRKTLNWLTPYQVLSGNVGVALQA